MCKITLKNTCLIAKEQIAIFLLLIFILVINTGYAQNDKKIDKWFVEAKQKFSGHFYDDAIVLCKKILRRDSTFTASNLLLADIYNAIDSTGLEIVSLEKAKKQELIPQVFYRLGNAYYSLGNYKKAGENFEKYITETKESSNRKTEVTRKLKNCQFATDAKRHPVDFHPVRLSDNINSESDEYWPNMSIDQKELVFTRLIKIPGYLPQEDFFVSEFDSLGWGRAQPIVEINTPENEGAQVISADGRLLFFTACNRKNGWGSCDIYYSRLKNGSWSVPKNAGGVVNSNYWEAQPGFSSDGRYLYFSSNRPGGNGNKDIWRAGFLGFDQNDNPCWEDPKNLGPKINTKGNETSPFIHPNNKSFYFASDYLTGMGRSDIFMSEIKDDSVFSEPKNLGYPVNTFNDEQGLFISADGKTGLFSSARNEITGLDIYSFILDEDIRPDPVTYLKARIVDAKSKKPVQAQLELVNLTNKNERTREETTDKNGEVLLVLPVGANYAFSVSKEGYLFFSESFVLSDINNYHNPYNLLVQLNPVEVGAEMNLYNVYFETDSFNILPESEPELHKLVNFLQKNPTLVVEIQGHTDNTGTSYGNQFLSELRAKSVEEYLVQHGIQNRRLTSTGYGETKPVATNETSAGRRLNRRTTVKIISR